MTLQIASLKNIEGLNEELLAIMKLLPKTDIYTGPWIGGGSVRRILKNDNINGDIDIFFKNREQLAKFENKLTQWIHDNQLSAEFGNLKPHSTHNAVTYDININNLKRLMNLPYDETKLAKPKKSGVIETISSLVGSITSSLDIDIDIEEQPSKYDENLKIQLITKYFVKDIEELSGKFDFTVCQLFTDTNNIVFDEKAFDDIEIGYLTINNKKFDVENSLMRISKYCSMNFIPVPGLFTEILTHPEQTFKTTQSES